MDDIKPTNEKDEYILEDVDYLKIKAMQELTKAIERLRRTMNK